LTGAAAASGALVLVPNALDFGAPSPGPLQAALPGPVLQRAARIRHWVVEDAKSARAFLGRVATVAPLAAPLQVLDIRELPRPRKGGTPCAEAGASGMLALLAPAQQGHDVGLLSEAGLPAVADPGAALVRAAHGLGLRVDALPGPSALMLALAASGLNGQHFAFIGYLPVPADDRARRIRELDGLSRRLKQTQIAIETPYRNAALLEALVEHLAPDTRLAVACALTWPEGWNRTLPVAQWRRGERAIDNRLPAVFLWQAA
jgi:16S rRNA (cytidine1402-2'-O)-methyltransferase